MSNNRRATIQQKQKQFTHGSFNLHSYVCTYVHMYIYVYVCMYCMSSTYNPALSRVHAHLIMLGYYTCCLSPWPHGLPATTACCTIYSWDPHTFSHCDGMPFTFLCPWLPTQLQLPVHSQWMAEHILDPPTKVLRYTGGGRLLQCCAQ